MTLLKVFVNVMSDWMTGKCHQVINIFFIYFPMNYCSAYFGNILDSFLSPCPNFCLNLNHTQHLDMFTRLICVPLLYSVQSLGKPSSALLH